MKLCFGLISFCSLVLTAQAAFAVNMSGTVYVTQTSETAAEAKTDAMNYARRQVLSKVLSYYTESGALYELLQNTPNAELIDLISSSSVANEKISADSYSANITMNVDNQAAKKWLVEHEIPNWIPNNETVEKFSMFIVVPNGLPDWAELKRIARESGADIETQNVSGNQIVAKMASNQRAKFTAAIRQMGWKYADNDGILKIWK